jgi:hypothetical protein
MDRILRQFKRIYSDDGRGDVDFSGPEEELRLAHIRLAKHTQDLARASENLNRAALSAIPVTKLQH